MPGWACRCVRPGPENKGSCSNLEQEEALGPSNGLSRGELRQMRQVTPTPGSQRIVVKKRFSFLHAEFRSHDVIRRSQLQWTRTRVVRVARNKMHDAFPDPAHGILLRARAERAGQRVS